jgi:ActR/RegA family two-component response regulator
MKKSDINVLIVDDDKSVCQALAESIRRLGFKPLLAHKAEEALQIIKIKHIHCAIIDVLLPKKSGVELATEFRASRFGGSPLILISGIFKDKSFASEAIRKTNAIDFIAKPFGFEDLSQVVMRALEPILSMERWTISSLLTSRFKSPREKIKAIERLGTVSGFHFPIVIATLMDAKATGHINIVTNKDELLGATVHDGRIVLADAKVSEASMTDLLVARDFLTREDVASATAAGDSSIEYFLNQGYVSPHALAAVKLEQIYDLLDQVTLRDELQINYVPSDVEPSRMDLGVGLEDLAAHMRSKPEIYFEPVNMREFYASVMSAPIRAISDQPVKLDPEISLMVTKSLSIEEAAKVSSRSLDDILSEIHAEFVARHVSFDDLAKVKSLGTLLERFERLYSEFKIRQPHEIFEYFGSDHEFRVADVVRIYNEYVEANHPDKLPKGANEDLKRLCRDCYQMLTEAYEMLSTSEGRQEYEANIRVQKGERQAYVHSLTEEGLEHLRRGQAQSASTMFREAAKILSSPRLIMLCIWADLKAQGAHIDREILQRAIQQLEAVPMDEKRTALYFMSLGLVKRSSGDLKAAQGFFERALQMDAGFVEARRELNSLQTQANSSRKVDILSGDISDVVSQIFRRKKG